MSCKTSPSSPTDSATGIATKTRSSPSSLLLLPVELPVIPSQITTLSVPKEARAAARRLLSQHSASSRGKKGALTPEVAAVPLLELPTSRRHHHKSSSSSHTPDADGSDGASPPASLENRLFHVGVAARVLHISFVASSSGGAYLVTLEGLHRIKLLEGEDGALIRSDWAVDAVNVEPEEAKALDPAVGPLTDQLRRQAASILGLPLPPPAPAGSPSTQVPRSEGILGPESSPSDLSSFLRGAPPGPLCDVLGGVLARGLNARLALLAAIDLKQRLQLVLSMSSAAARALSLLTAKSRKNGSDPDGVTEDNGRTAPRLRSLSSILRSSPGMSLPALGAGGGGDRGDGERARPSDPLDALGQKLEGVGMPREALEQCKSELARLRRLGEGNPSSASVQTWLETMADLPWSRLSAHDGSLQALTLAQARAVLDQDHHGLDAVKKRIVEYVAVLKIIAGAAAAAASQPVQDSPGDAALGGGGAVEDNNTVPSRSGPEPSTSSSPSPKGPVLCLVGPPGVGKTSLGKSIARALGARSFQRVALGGVRDESEIRGHRRTYVGALPGRIVQALRKAGSRDCVLLLDEIDKMGRDPLRGDPASALLEVLDPSQNSHFVDAYLGTEFPLDKVIFVCTANSTATIPPPLLDRMEVIRIPGYTLDEKVEIARRHLLHRVASDHALNGRVDVQISSDVLRLLIEGYTREAGVRSLERALAAIYRHLAVKVVDATTTSSPEPSSSSSSSLAASPSMLRVEVTQALLEEVLGSPIFSHADVANELDGLPGVTAGLVYSPSGGSVQFVEAVSIGMRPPGTQGTLLLTGQLGEVLNESAKLALSWIRANGERIEGVLSETVDPRTADRLGLGKAAGTSRFISAAARSDVHVHFPAGAIPKDGPSAGVTLTCSLISLFSGVPVRNDVAMTGELSLRGHVLPIGGVKEKVLAAHRAGLAAVLLPEKNLRDVEGDNLPETVRKEMKLVGVKDIVSLIRVAFKDVYVRGGEDVAVNEGKGAVKGGVEPAGVPLAAMSRL